MVKRLPSPKNKQTLAVPLSIRIFNKCIDHKIDFSLVKHLHFFDLQCLIMRIEISKIESYLEQEEQAKQREKGVNVKDITGAEALKFLRG